MLEVLKLLEVLGVLEQLEVRGSRLGGVGRGLPGPVRSSPPAGGGGQPSPPSVPPCSRPVRPSPAALRAGAAAFPAPRPPSAAGSGAAPARPWGCAPPASSAAAAACCPSCSPQPQVRTPAPSARRDREGRRLGKVLGVWRGRRAAAMTGALPEPSRSPPGVPGRRRHGQPSLQPGMLVSSGRFSLAADGARFSGAGAGCQWLAGIFQRDAWCKCLSKQTNRTKTATEISS